MLRKLQKFISLTLSLLLVLSVFAGIRPSTAQAAVASFFIPDDGMLKSTANIDLTTLDRSTAFLTNDQKISITGSYQQVTDTSMSVTVDQIAYVGSAWVPQAGKTFNTSVLTDGPSRFKINSLPLFPGYNRVTISGQQNNVSKSDVFYVLFEASPVLKSMQMMEGNTKIDLNEGSKIVTKQQAIVITGKAVNTDEIFVNGVKGSITPDTGTYYTSAISLVPGVNDLNFSFKNNNGEELRITRQVYLYDPNQPFSKVVVNHGSLSKDIAKGSQTFTSSNMTATLSIEMMVPYNPYNPTFPFDSTNAKLTVDTGDGSGPVAVAMNSITTTTINNALNNPDSVLVTFTTANVNLADDGTGKPAPNQIVKLNLTYGDPAPAPSVTPLNVAKNFTFKVAVNQTQLKNVYLLPNVTDPTTIDASTQRNPLDGSEVSSTDYYIAVEADTSTLPVAPAPALPALNIDALPLGTVTYTALPAQNFTVAATSSTFFVYQVNNFPEGVSNLQFHYGGQSSIAKAKVTYVSKNYVLLNNIYSGMIIEVDSSTGVTPKVPVNGQLVGFQGHLLSDQFIVNGVDMTSTFDTALAVDPTNQTFALNLNVDAAAGPLYVGENRIKFIVRYTAGTIVRDYTNEVKVYIVDKNVPTVKLVIPLTPPSGAHANNLDSSTASDYLVPSNEFQPKPSQPGSYTTTLKTVDYFLEASGATTVTVKQGGNVLFQFKPTLAPSLNKETALPGQTSGFTYIGGPVINNLSSGSSLDYYGDQSMFRIRINNLPIDTPGTYLYTVELKNDTGAPVAKTITIERNPAPYRVYAPVANVGNRIVVNRNFVDFDIEAEGASSVSINGVNAVKAPNTDRFTTTVSSLKPDKDNSIPIVITRPSGNTSDTITVYYASDVDVDAMYLTKLTGKMTVFNKQLELTFPKNMVMRRSSDKKIYPDNSILFGIASPVDGYLGRVDDYGNSIDDPITSINMPPVYAQLYEAFKRPAGGIERFSNVSPYYWISAGYAERDNPGQTNYQQATGGLKPYNNKNMFISTPSYPDINFRPDLRKLLPTERGELTLTFDPNIVDDTGSYITVFFLGDSGEWKNIGGIVNMKSNTITVPFSDFGYYTVGKLKYSFPDITNHAWARNVLQALFAKGLMPNFEYSFFHTDEDTTRGEFAAMLVRALDLPLVQDQDATFLDITWGSRTISWNFEEIETAARAGIISGFSDRTFEAGLPITREQAATMIAKALNLKLALNDSKLQGKVSKKFTDSAKMSIYALPAIDAVSSAKIMVGNAPDPVNPKAIAFNPQANLTRAEAGQILVSILQKYRKVFPINLS